MTKVIKLELSEDELGLIREALDSSSKVEDGELGERLSALNDRLEIYELPFKEVVEDMFWRHMDLPEGVTLRFSEDTGRVVVTASADSLESYRRESPFVTLSSMRWDAFKNKWLFVNGHGREKTAGAWIQYLLSTKVEDLLFRED